MKFISNKLIQIDRELSDLDIFTLDFVNAFGKRLSYVIVSGYVSILLGRARASEDIDIIVSKISFLEFSKLLRRLESAGFYCLNTEGDKKIFDYLTDGIAVRFAKINTVIPNMEFKFSKNKIDRLCMKRAITANLNNKKINISELELQVAFKEVVLKSPKDLEDARHLRNIWNMDEKLIEKYKVMLNEFY